MARDRERERLQREISAREKAEKIQEEYEAKLAELQRTMEGKQNDLLEAKEQIHKLEDQLRETQAAKEELEEGQRELQEMMQKLEESKHMEAEERARLREEIDAKMSEVSVMQEQVEAKERENRELQEEMADARRRHEDASRALADAANGPVKVNGYSINNNNGYGNTLERKAVRAEKSERLQSQLLHLKEDLAATRADDEAVDTEMDRLHRENVRMGRDKYKTLREVRKGNTKRRVDQFENM